MRYTGKKVLGLFFNLKMDYRIIFRGRAPFKPLKRENTALAGLL